MLVSSRDLESFCVQALLKAGLVESDARLTADVLVTTDAWGVFTHGTKNLCGYIRRLRGGGIRATAKPRIEREGPAWTIIDGEGALGTVASTFAMRAAVTKAKAAGIGYVGVHNSCHFGAAGYYAALAAHENLIGVAMSNDTPTMTAPGGSKPVLGSNPFAFAAPTGEKHPILLDMATSAVAGGKVFAAAALGKPIPENWIVDADGRPATDPKLFPDSAALLPMAGHKGYGLALLIEILSAVLTGAAVTRQVLSWSFADPSLATNHGAAFIAVDIISIMPPNVFKQRVTEMIQEIRQSPKAIGCDRIFVPGEMEWERRERALAQGIELPPDVVTSLRTLAGEMDLRPDWLRD